MIRKGVFFQSVHCRRGKCYGAGGVASLRPVLLKFYHAPLLLGAGARQGPCLRTCAFTFELCLALVCMLPYVTGAGAAKLEPS